MLFLSQLSANNQATTNGPVDEYLGLTPAMLSGTWKNVSLSNVDYEYTIISDTPRTKQEAYDICKSINARYC